LGPRRRVWRYRHEPDLTSQPGRRASASLCPADRSLPNGVRAIRRRSSNGRRAPRCHELSLRDVELLLAERGIVVSYETVRRWGKKFGQSFADCLRRRRSRPSDKWHISEVFMRVQGVQHHLWRAFDQHGVVLDTLFRIGRRRSRCPVRNRINSMFDRVAVPTPRFPAPHAPSWPLGCAPASCALPRPRPGRPSVPRCCAWRSATGRAEGCPPRPDGKSAAGFRSSGFCNEKQEK
jgi:hypothetical protein